MKRIKEIFITGSLLVAFSVFGQDTIQISKSEIVQKMTDQNLQLKIANKSVESAPHNRVRKFLPFCPTFLPLIQLFQPLIH